MFWLASLKVFKKTLASGIVFRCVDIYFTSCLESLFIILVYTIEWLFLSAEKFLFWNSLVLCHCVMVCMVFRFSIFLFKRLSLFILNIFNRTLFSLNLIYYKRSPFFWVSKPQRLHPFRFRGGLLRPWGLCMNGHCAFYWETTALNGSYLSF